MEKQMTENKKMEAGFAVNKSTFYKEVVQYECRWHKNKMPNKGKVVKRLHVRKYHLL